MLDVETGLIRFNGPYNNPRSTSWRCVRISAMRAGVQVTGSALAPRVKLYSDPDLPDADKLVGGAYCSAAGGGAEAAVLQQAALALLGRGGTNFPAANAAPAAWAWTKSASKARVRATTPPAPPSRLAKRLSKDLYVTYERSLSGTLGTSTSSTTSAAASRCAGKPARKARQT